MLVPAIVLAVAGTYYVYREEQRAYRISVRETVRALAGVVDKELARREDIVHNLAASPLLDSGDFATFHALARRIAPRWDGVIVLTDPQGYQILNTRRPYPPPQKLPRNISFPEDRERFGPLATVFSRLYVAPIGGQPSFAIEVPALRDGKVVHYVGMGSFTTQLQPILADTPKDWTIALLDRDGTIVARNIDPEKHVGQRARDDLVQRSREAEEGFYETQTRDGTPVQAYFTRVPRAGWTLAVGVPQAQVLSSARRAAALVGGGALALVALALGLAAAFGRGIAVPVRKLAQDAERLGRGEAVAPAPTGLREADTVGAELARASAALRDSAAEMERRIAKALEEAERSQRELLQARKLDALGRLTGGIAHDFNNLLQTLATGVQVVAMKPLDAESKRAVEACRRALEQATRLTRQLSAFARGKASQAERLDLRNRLLGMTELLRGALRSDIELRFHVSADLWPIEVDPMQLELALINLAINARDAIAQYGRVDVSAVNCTLGRHEVPGLDGGEFVCLSVEDTGAGMSGETLERAMEPFFTTKEVGRGSGLGLAQVYAFSKHAGGAVLLSSEPGRGTRVALYLPRALAQAGAEARPPAGRPATGLRVLLVEDEEMIRDIAVPALRGQGCEVIAARNAEEALQILGRGEGIDAVFSDIVMPGRYSGIDLADLVSQRYPGVAVLLTTGYSEQLASVRRYPVLAKPYDVETVATRLRALRAPGLPTQAARAQNA